MAAHVQETTWQVSAGTPASAQVTLTGVTAGSTLLVRIAQTGAALRTYTVNSDVGGGLAQLVSYNPSLGAHVYALRGAAAGTHILTATSNTGTAAFYMHAEEVTGLDTTAPVTTGFFLDDANANNHFAAASGDIDVSGAGYGIVTAVLNSASGVSSVTAGTDWTATTNAAAVITAFGQYRIYSGAVADDRGAWTSGGSARTGTACIAFIPDAAAPPADRVYPRITRRRLPGGLF